MRRDPHAVLYVPAARGSRLESFFTVLARLLFGLAVYAIVIEVMVRLMPVSVANNAVLAAWAFCGAVVCVVIAGFVGAVVDIWRGQ